MRVTQFIDHQVNGFSTIEFDVGARAHSHYKLHVAVASIPEAMSCFLRIQEWYAANFECGAFYAMKCLNLSEKSVASHKA
jgi:hypothetical protein